jgi:hypothetical protein
MAESIVLPKHPNVPIVWPKLPFRTRGSQSTQPRCGAISRRRCIEADQQASGLAGKSDHALATFVTQPSQPCRPRLFGNEGSASEFPALRDTEEKVERRQKRTENHEDGQTMLSKRPNYALTDNDKDI